MACPSMQTVEFRSLPRIRVDGVDIDEQQLASELQYHPADSYEQAVRKASEALIVRQLLLQEADVLRIEAEPEEDQLSSDESRIRRLLEQAIPPAQTDDTACRNWFERNPGRLRSPWQMHLRHILLACAPDDLPERERLREVAEALLQELQEKPHHFDSLNQRHSACPSKEQGGDLGWVKRGQLVPELEKSLLRFDTGLLPVPLETRYGIHVIEILAREGGQPLTFEEARPKVVHYLNAQRTSKAIREYIDELARRAVIEGYDFVSKSE